MSDDLNRLNSKLTEAMKDADRHKKLYWSLRLQVIAYLGGHCDCGESEISKLDIHHVEPHLEHKRPGGQRIQFWRDILAGKAKAKLCCRDCHVNNEHDGNTNALKLVKKEVNK